MTTSTIEIAGTIDEVNKPALYISSNGSRKDGTITLTETGVISNVTGYCWFQRSVDSAF